jgi:hypothetical protein
VSPRLLYLIMIRGLRLAATARPQPGVQERRDPGSPSRSHAAASSGRPARAGLGRPGGPGGVGPVAARGAAGPPARHTWHTAGLAPPSHHAQVDVPEKARPPQHQPGDPRSGAAAGTREPGLGVPQGARRGAPTRSPRQRGDRAADPARPRAQTGPAESGHVLAGVPACSGARAPGLRFLPCGHDFADTPVCAVRDGSGDPARAHPGRDRPPGRFLDRPAGPQPAHGPRRRDWLFPLPHPGPRRQVHQCVRQHLRCPGGEDSKEPAADATRELLCREMDTHSTSRVHRPDPGLRRTAPSISPQPVRPSLQTSTGPTSPASNDHPTTTTRPALRWTCRFTGARCSAA